MTFMKFTGKKELKGIRKILTLARPKQYYKHFKLNFKNKGVRRNIGLTVCMLLALTTAGCGENNQNDAEVQNEVPTMDIGEPHGTAGDNETAESEDLGKQLAVEYLEKKLEINEQFEDIKDLFGGLNAKEAYIETLKTIQTDNIDYVYLAFEDDSFHILPKQELPPDYVASDRPWYQGAIEDGHYEDEYLDAFTEKMFYSIAEPVGNEKIGQVVLGIDFVLEEDLEKAEAYSNYIFNEIETQSQNSQEDLREDEGSSTDMILHEDDLKAWEKKIIEYSEDLDGQMDEAHLKNLLKRISEDHSQVKTAYIASPEGDFYMSDDVELPEGYDPRQRPWYDDAMNEKGLYIAQPYEDLTSGKMITSVFMELDKAPEEGWVLGVDLEQ